MSCRTDSSKGHWDDSMAHMAHMAHMEQDFLYKAGVGTVLSIPSPTRWGLF